VTTLIRLSVVLLCCSAISAEQNAQPTAPSLTTFRIKSGGLELERPTHAGAFFDVTGRRAAIFGYENRDAEAWVYPLEIVDGLALSFRLEGYPLEIDRGTMASIHVRPDATTLVYAHSAFTVRQIMFAPLDEPGLVILLDVDSVLPLSITASFQPRLRLMWPAPSTSANLSWDADAHVYYLTEETNRFAGVVGSPEAHDVSLMPYQEEPRDLPNRFVIDAPRLADARSGQAPGKPVRRVIPIVITGSVEGRAAAKAAYDRILSSIPELYAKTAEHYARLDRETINVSTPEPRLDTAFRWAKIGIDKGVVTNPQLGTGLIAGYRTAGDSERPGYAWFFGRDSLWTTLATTASGAFDTTRTALEFLRKFQRDDGKIPHEISQSAALIPWFTNFGYPWASADATPLYVIAHAEYWRASADRAFLEAAWPSVQKAYKFSAATDTDGNGLIENTNVGHGWVEGGALYPPHEEMYMQGLWVAASRGMADLASVMHDEATEAAARQAAERTREAMERTYWLDGRGFYAFATARPTRIVDEDTVLPAVPLWLGTVDGDRAQLELDHLGGGAIQTDWGSRILSDRSKLYDPLSYHYGSVWPLFTGWSAVAAYRYGRPNVGYTALMSNALLTWPGALGYVTELLSGDYATAFGRSSHHQIWSEAMVVAPVVKGLLGIDADEAGGTLQFAPALPATWDHADATNVAMGATRYDLSFRRGRDAATARITAHARSDAPAHPHRVTVSPAFPADARIRSVTVNGTPRTPEVRRIGDEQRVSVAFDLTAGAADVVFTGDQGTDVEAEPVAPVPGATNEGLRLLRVGADDTVLHIVAEGIGGRMYTVRVRSSRRISRADGVTVLPSGGETQSMQLSFEGSGGYVRREFSVPLSRRLP
jgi:Glycosyl-hydrolase family 116, catalytic region